MGRRNISPEQQSYLRGVQYEREKGKQGGTGANQHEQSVRNSHSAKTAGKLAQQHKVHPDTIRSDAKYARAVNAIEKAAGGNAESAIAFCHRFCYTTPTTEMRPHIPLLGS